MCGIVGIYGFHHRYDIEKMMNELSHRGHDSCGLYDTEDVVLGHQRLSIIDLSPAGKQPMTNEDSTIWMVVNGEIYNYKELRAELISSGHIFKSQCDSEIIVHAYEKYGHGFVNRLRGMFAIALYDKKNNELVLARDPIGKKPLYYYQQGNKLVFASEIKALFKAGVPCEINYDAIPSYLMYQYTIGENTLFKGVKKLLAGHIMVILPNDSFTHQYFSLCDRIQHDGLRLRELLEESVQLRLQADVPVGSFLSGGIDSSAVTALYRKFCNGKIHTFTASFEHNSEAKYAKIVSEHLGTEYHEIMITDKMIANDIKKITWHHDEPLGDAATINNYYLSKEAKKYVTVVLAGEGGDEVFGGYPWYEYSKYIPFMNLMPSFLRQIGQYALYFITKGDITSKSYGIGRILSFPLQSNKYEMILYPTTAMNKANLRWLMEYNNYEIFAIIPQGIHNNYNQALAMDCLNLLAEKFLMKADKATMAFAIEERLPLLDKEIIKYAFTLSPNLKRDKYILRKSVEDLLPSEIVWRKKQGFGTPLNDWINGGLKEMALDSLNNGQLLKEICKKESLKKLSDILSNNQLNKDGLVALDSTNIVWSLLALQTWYDVWFNT